MLLKPFTFHSPKSVEELTKLSSELDSFKLQAGGTFLLNALKLLKRNDAKTPEHIISLRNIQSLNAINQENGSLRIGSMTSIADIFEANDQLTNNLKVLKTVCKNISTQPIRNMATIGGNLTCRYTWTEMPAVAVGLEAQLNFVTLNNKEEKMSAEDFFKAQAKTNHILTSIDFKIDPKATVAYRRVKKTQFVDIPMLSLLIKTNVIEGKFTNTVVAVNNCVEFAQRDRQLEDFLNGKECHASIAQEALDHITESIYDKRSSDYKKHMFRLSIQEALEEICQNN